MFIKTHTKAFGLFVFLCSIAHSSIHPFIYLAILPSIYSFTRVFDCSFLPFFFHHFLLSFFLYSIFFVIFRLLIPLLVWSVSRRSFVRMSLHSFLSQSIAKWFIILCYVPEGGVFSAVSITQGKLVNQETGKAKWDIKLISICCYCDKQKVKINIYI